MGFPPEFGGKGIFSLCSRVSENNLNSIYIFLTLFNYFFLPLYRGMQTESSSFSPPRREFDVFEEITFLSV